MSFKTERGWPSPGFDLSPLRLPPRPGIKKIMMDVCTRCGVVHTHRKDLIECLSAPREQK